MANEQNSSVQDTDWTHLGRGYMPYVKGSTDSVRTAAITAILKAESFVLNILGEEEAEKLFRTKVSGPFTFMYFDFRSVAAVIGKYVTEQLEPKIKDLPKTEERYKRIAARIAVAKSIAAAILQRSVYGNFDKFFVVATDESRQDLVHIWNFADSTSATHGFYLLANSHIKLAGPLSGDLPAQEAQEQAELDPVLQSIGQQLHVFFKEAAARNIQLPPMQKDAEVADTETVHCYVLSHDTRPTISQFFAAATSAQNASAAFQRAANSIRTSVEHLPASDVLYVVADLGESPSYAFFVHKETAHKFMQMKSIERDPTFRKTIAGMFAHSESYEDYGTSEDPAEFVIDFLVDEDTAHSRIMTAYAKKRMGPTMRDPMRYPEALLPPIIGVLLSKDGPSMTCVIFDAKKIIVHIVKDVGHFDHNGIELVKNLIRQGHWANLLEFCFSALGESKALSITKSTEHDLGSDPMSHVVSFSQLVKHLV